MNTFSLPKTQHLVVFQEVIRSGSIGAGAKALGLTQPAVSKIIGDMESYFAAKLALFAPEHAERGVVVVDSALAGGAMGSTHQIANYPGFPKPVPGWQLAENFREARQSWKLDLALPDGGQIELFSFPAPPPRPSRPEAQGLRHLAFRVEDVAGWKARLEAAGIAVEPIRVDEYTGRRFTFFADPDGLPLELYESGGKAACTPENQGNGA